MEKLAQALSDLHYTALRSSHVKDYSRDELFKYMNDVAIAFDGIARRYASFNEIPLITLQEIDALDPSSDGWTWGHWCMTLCLAIDQKLPQK